MKTQLITLVLVILSMVVLSLQDVAEVSSTSPLFMWTVNGGRRGIYNHYKVCKDTRGGAPFQHVKGAKVIILQNNMATEEFLELSGAYEYTSSNIFPTLEKILKDHPSEVYPTCETESLQIFDTLKTKKVSVEELKTIELKQDTTYIVDSERLIFLDSVVADVHAAIAEKDSRCTIVVMAAKSNVPLNIKDKIASNAQSFDVSQVTEDTEEHTNNLYIDGAVAGGTLVGLFLLGILAITLKALLSLQSSEHIGDDYKMKDLKKTQ